MEERIVDDILMEDLVEEYIIKAWFVKEVNYYKEMKASEVVKKFGIDLWPITNKWKTEKRFDLLLRLTTMFIELKLIVTHPQVLNWTRQQEVMKE